MYRCYCKILKKLNNLEKEVQLKDDDLLLSVQDIREDLDANTQHDIEQQEQIDNIEAGAAGTQAIEDEDIQSLFGS